MPLKPRPRYLDRLESTRNNGFVKVLTGMRRCGKSSILALYAQQLRGQGVPDESIVSINFESFRYEGVRTASDMHALVTAQLPKNTHAYLLLDEVQFVEGWERAVNGLRVDEDVDIYVTGSNAHMLSGQIATLLSGRQLEIPVHPLSFSEFISYVDEPGLSPEAAFERYARFGGLPPVVEQGTDEGLASTVLSGIYSTVFVRDIAQHAQVRNQAVFDDIARYLADTAGSGVSLANVERRLAAQHRKVSVETIERYAQALVDAFLFHRTRRIDLKGSEILQGQAKYYPCDLGMRTMLLGFGGADYGFVLENVVHNELVRRGYRVHVGKSDRYEVDFVAERHRPDLSTDRLLVQVTASMLDPQTRERELRPLRLMRDAPGAKLVVTLDRMGLGTEEGGIEVRNALDWLCETW